MQPNIYLALSMPVASHGKAASTCQIADSTCRCSQAAGIEPTHLDHNQSPSVTEGAELLPTHLGDTHFVAILHQHSD